MKLFNPRKISVSQSLMSAATNRLQITTIHLMTLQRDLKLVLAFMTVVLNLGAW